MAKNEVLAKDDTNGRLHSLDQGPRSLEKRLRAVERIARSEQRDLINIGSMKVPEELSGIVGAVILILTGVLITLNRWDIIRSAGFSFGIALVLAAAVILRFYIANRSSE